MPAPLTDDGFSLEIQVPGCHHLGCEIGCAVAGGLGPDEASAVIEPLAGENAGVFVGDLLVVAVHVTDFTAAHADVAGGNVAVGADVPEEFPHEGLGELHHFHVRFAFGIEIGAALAAAHGKRGQRVLEYLLEAQKLDDAQVYRGVETKSALVGADGVVELNAETAVDLYIAFVVQPGHAEHDHAVGLNDALIEFRFYEFRVFFHRGLKGFKHFLDGLVKLGFARISFFNF